MPNDITESAAPESIVVDGSPYSFAESETLTAQVGALDEETEDTPFAVAIDTGGEG